MSDELTLFHRTTPEAAAAIIREGRMMSKENTREAFFSDRLDGEAEGYGEAAVEIRVPENLAELEDEFPGGEQHFRVRVDRLAPEHFVRAHQPWQQGDEDARWAAYLDPQTGILRNLVGARTWAELRDREDPAVEARMLELAHRPVVETFDLDHLRALHGRLFQDVYPWAGETRTVDMQKPGSIGFLPHDMIEESFGHAADAISRAGRFRGASIEDFRATVPELYNLVNTVHAFREGNGRTQRLFVSQLAEQAGFTLDWQQVAGVVNDRASLAARMGNMEPLRRMFTDITAESPARRAAGVLDPTRSSGGPAQPLDRARPEHLMRQSFRAPYEGRGR